MSYFSDISCEDERDCNSILSNSMYVLPNKTVLNSLAYLHTQEKSNHTPTLNNENNFNPRIVGGNINIPSYIGFSIVNGSKKPTKQRPLKPPKVYVDGLPIDDCPQKRKVHIIIDNKKAKENKNRFSKLNVDTIKIKQKKNINETLTTVEKKQKDIKPTDSFWMECGQQKPLGKRNRNNSNNNKESGHHKSYNENEIKAYIANKKRLTKEALKEKNQIENERKMRIKMNLRTIAENQHKPDANVTTTKKSIVKNKYPFSHPQVIHRDIPEQDRSVENSYQSVSTDRSTDTSASTPSIKNKLSDWQPLDKEIFEGFASSNKETVQRATAASKHTCDILNSIQMLSNKMELSKRDMLFLTANKVNDWIDQLPANCEDASESEMRSESSYEVSSGSYKSRNCAKPNMVQEMMQKPKRNETMDCFSDDNQLKYSTKRLRIETSDSEDCIERLREENKRRYQEALDNRTTLIFPFNKSSSKPTAPVMPYQKELPVHCHSDLFADDPYKFIKIYKRSSRRSVSPDSHSPEIQKPHIDYPEVDKSLENPLTHSHTSKDSASISRVNESLETRHSATIVVEEEDTSESGEISKEKSSVKESPLSSIPKRKVPPMIADQSRKISYSQEARLSPASLERQFKAEIEYFDSLDVGFQHLLQADRLEGVAVAQQETASLAQILKARQCQDSQRQGTSDRLATAIENMTRNFSKGYKKRQMSYSTSSSSRRSSSGQASSTTSSKNSSENRASTETNASEIEEEIFENASISSASLKIVTTNVVKDVVQRPPVLSKIKISTERKNAIQTSVIEDTEITENIENFTGYSDSEMEVEKSDSESKSIKTVSTMKSVDSASSVTDNKDLSPKEISTDRSVEAASTSPKTDKDISSTIKESISEVQPSRSDVASEIANKSSSSDISVPTESIPKASDRDNTNKSDSLKEISTARSVASETSQSKNENTENQTKESEADYSLNTFENSVTKSLRDGNHALTEHSDIEARISALVHEKNKKKEMVTRLTKDLTRTKNIRKEKALQEQIQLLNRHISLLENEIVQSDATLSSISSIQSPVNKKKTKKEKNIEQILPNHSSISSSSTSTAAAVSFSTNKEIDKPASLHSQDQYNNSIGSDSSSTLISDKDNTLSVEDQKSKGKADEVDTPRSVKQLQFGDINEEYSASDHDSSEIRTPSEKSRLSKEVTDNGATKSKSEKFHFLNLDGQLPEEPPVGNLEEQRIPQDDNGMLSARTIHSEISEIPDECVDISDHELEESDKCNVEIDLRKEQSEKDQESSYKDLYSENFSESSSHKVTKSQSGTVTDSEEVVTEKEETKYSPEVTVETSGDHSPVIPPRRKEKPSETEVIDVISDKEVDDYNDLVDVICQKELNDFLQELLEYVCDNLETSHRESSPQSSFLIPWEDEHILPVVDLAVGLLFSARENRVGRTDSALGECRTHFSDHIRPEMVDMSPIVAGADHRRHVNKMLICDLVFEIVQSIFVLDDEPPPSPWMREAAGVRLSRMMPLWRSARPPESAVAVAEIARQELRRMEVLGGGSGRDSRGPRRSRLHLWFLGQHRDRVDRILVDETVQEEGQWGVYEPLEEEILFQRGDAIADQLLQDGLASCLL